MHANAPHDGDLMGDSKVQAMAAGLRDVFGDRAIEVVFLQHRSAAEPVRETWRRIIECLREEEGLL